MVISATWIGGLPTVFTREALELKQVFQSVTVASCPREFNFHMHTHHSDGQLAPEHLVEQAIALGLREFAITDHHSIKGYWQAKRCLEDWRWKHPAPINSSGQRSPAQRLPRLWTGVEITSLLEGIEVHILGYGFNPHDDALQLYLQGNAPKGNAQEAEQVIHAIHAAGGLAVLAHPCRYRLSAQELVPAAVKLGIDGIETYYAYDNPQDWRPCPKQTPAMEHVAERFGILSTCGTDTHGKALTRRL